jgi:hypothetical protein
MQRIITHANLAAFAAQNQRRQRGNQRRQRRKSARQGADIGSAARATPTCKYWVRRQGPSEVTAVDSVAHQKTCRRWGGSMCLPALDQAAVDTCRLPKRAACPDVPPPRDGFFNKFFGRWSFLTIY